MNRLGHLFTVGLVMSIVVSCSSGGGGAAPAPGKAWHHPASLSDNISPDGSTAMVPRAAADASGAALVVWSQNDGSFFRAYKSEFRNGVWSHPTSTAERFDPGGAHVNGHQAVMDDNGNTVIVWVQDQLGIYKSEYRNGVWTHPTSSLDRVNNNSTTGATAPRVAMDNSGNAIIVWQQSDGSKQQIYMREYRGGNWSAVPALTTRFSPTGQDAYNAQVAMDNNGNAIIVWEQNDGTFGTTFSQIYKREYRGGNWAAVPALTSRVSPTGEHAYWPQVEMDDLGNAVIAWMQYYVTSTACGFMGFAGPCSAVFMSEYRDSIWTSPTSTAQHISPTANNTTTSVPSVAMDGNGNAIIAWAQSDGVSQCTTGPAMWSPCTNIFKSEYRSGVWSHPTTTAQFINPSGAGITASSPQVRMNATGDAIIGWRGNASSSNDCMGSSMPCSQIYKSEYRNSAWIHPSSLADNISPDGQEANLGGVALSNNGNAFIVWGQQDGAVPQSYSQIFMSEYR
ncbi:MAG: hypothetical protein AABZ15_01485 [Nitrospirota bacterium]